MSGTFYGIGLGPGDVELLTLKAARQIAAADVIAYPALPGADSFARSIAAAHFKRGVREIRIELPMMPAREPAQAAYDTGAKDIAAALEAGQDVVFLCEGDPLFYGSFMYLQARLAARFQVVTVPGVSSLNAASAATGVALAARNQVLTVLPAPLPDKTLSAGISQADQVAIVKLGRHLPRIRTLLRQLGQTGNASYIERASLPEQVVLPLAEAPEVAPYFSIILITKGRDPWL